ncbi:MAG: hypothetical protein R2766_02635 [Saprospiraceae bacterium]
MNPSSGFTQEVHFDNFDYRNGGRAWRRWNDDYTNIPISYAGVSEIANQPILSDIEFDDDGDMIVGFMSRWGHQMGSSNYKPIASNTELTNAIAHEMLHICNQNGAWSY